VLVVGCLQLAMYVLLSQFIIAIVLYRVSSYRTC